MDLAYFTARGDALLPTDIARSAWKDTQMHGVAVSGALARTAETTLAEIGREDLRPARFTVDLFKPAGMEPCHLIGEVTRQGPRIALIDVTLTQGGVRVARAAALFLKPSEPAPGDLWSPDVRPAPPTEQEVPLPTGPRAPYLLSEVPGAKATWTQSFREHQNGARKHIWNTALPVVAGEPVTGFQAVAAFADSASLATNWGSNGVEYINTDITLALARLPEGDEVGLAALDRVEEDGIAVGTAAVLDRQGQIGTVVITSLANARRTVNFENVGFTDDGRRQRR